MKTSPNGRKFITQFEGVILHTYDDGTGVLTIGVGHTTAAGPPKVVRGQTITRDQADQILASDLGKVETQVNNLVHVPINQNQFDALVSFHFNTGALGRSTALKLLNKGDYNGCARAFLAYNRAGGRVLSGLSRRRDAERKLFLTPTNSVAVSGPVTIAVGTGGAVAAQHMNWFQAHPYLSVLGVVGVAAVIGSIVHVIHNRKT